MKIKELIDNPVKLNRPNGVSDTQWVKALELYQAAKNIGDKFPELTVAQAALETGWFKKESGKNNFFGQKASKSQKGSIVSTHEVIGGNRKAVKDRFRDYDSLENSLLDRKEKWMSKYADATTPQEAIDKIWKYDENKKQGVGYATDPEYGNKINTILSMMGVESTTGAVRPRVEKKDVEIDNTAVAKKPFIPLGTGAKNANYISLPDLAPKKIEEQTKNGITEEQLRDILSNERKNTESRFLNAFKQQNENQNQELKYELPQEDLSYLYDYIDIDNYADGGKHTVKEGDSLSKIAKENNLTLEEILELNAAYKSNPNLLNLGEEIITESPEAKPEALTIDKRIYEQLREKDNIYSKEPFFHNISKRPTDNEDLNSLDKKTYEELKGEKPTMERSSIPNVPALNLKEVTGVSEEISRFNSLDGLVRYATSDSLYNQSEDQILNDLKKGKITKEEVESIQMNLAKDGYLNIKEEIPETKEEILKLQQKLSSEGFNLGKFGENKDGIDGKFGNLTIKALKKYNESRTTIDGKFGKLTKEALEARDKGLEKQTEDILSEMEKEVPDEDVDLKGITDTRDTGIIKSGINKVPVFVRQYLYDTIPSSVGGAGDVTQNDLNDGEYKAMTEIVRSAIQNNRTTISYDDFRAAGAPGEDVRTSDVDFTNSAQSVQLLLGSASIEIDKEGEIYVKDEYDYNDAGKKTNRYKNKHTNKEGYLKLKESTSPTNVLYRLARNFKTATAREPGKGSKVSIHMGNIKDYK